MKISALLLLVLLCGSPRAVAQQTEARAQAAAELLDVIGYEREADEGMKQILAQLSAGQPPGTAPSFQAAMEKFFEAHFTWEQLKPEYVRIYADLFTEEELRRMTAFYRTPTGQKLARLQTEIGLRSIEISQRIMQQHMPQLLEYLRAAEPAAATPPRP